MTHIYIDHPRQLELAEGPLAIDTEFHAEKRYTPSLHLIQLRAPEGPAFLVDPHVPGMLEGVSEALRSRPWIVHAGRVDLQLLHRALGGVPEQVFDTQIAAGLVYSDYPAGLARLCQTELGIPLDKSATLSDWSKRPLSLQQQLYAAGDVEHLHALWAALSDRATALERTAIVAEACRTAREASIEERPVDDAWMSIPGRLALRPERAVVLRELAAWREAQAREHDQPPNSILSNRVLFDLAKRRPITRETLLAGRRSPQRVLSRHADALLDHIRRATSRPDWAEPRTFAKGSLHEARLSWLRAFASTRAQAASWSARLVLPEADLEAIAYGVPPEDQLHDWQLDLAGHELAATLRSNAGIACPPIMGKDFSQKNLSDVSSA